MSTTIKVGELLPSNTTTRDAIHVAVAAVDAAEGLDPGDHIGITEDGKASTTANHCGIVDPFLTKHVNKGETFYIFLYPGTVTSLCHIWEHPAFVKNNQQTSDKSASEEWIRNYERMLGKYEGWAISAAEDYLDYGDYIHCGSSELGLPLEFWDHFENVTGRRVGNDKRGSFFACSC